MSSSGVRIGWVPCPAGLWSIQRDLIPTQSDGKSCAEALSTSVGRLAVRPVACFLAITRRSLIGTSASASCSIRGRNEPDTLGSAVFTDAEANLSPTKFCRARQWRRHRSQLLAAEVLPRALRTLILGATPLLSAEICLPLVNATVTQYPAQR